MPRLPQQSTTSSFRVPPWTRRLIGPAWLLGLWIVLSRTGVISEKMLAPPGKVWSAFTDLVSTGELQHHLWVSLHRVATGLAIGITIGVVLAVLAGLFRIGEDIIDGPMQILRSLPVLALVPLMIFWLGIGEEPKIALVSLGVTFPIYINTFAAIRSVDAGLVESATTFGLRRPALVRHVVLQVRSPDSGPAVPYLDVSMDVLLDGHPVAFGQAVVPMVALGADSPRLYYGNNLRLPQRGTYQIFVRMARSPMLGKDAPPAAQFNLSVR